MLKENQLQELINEMTIEEKIDMLHGSGFFTTKGIKRLNIPPLTMSDGPMGVRNEFPKDSWVPKNVTDDYVTYFPSNTALAATWNTNLAYTFGQDLGSESRSRGKDIILAPGINIIRSPLCGRNFEYMSEDPHLISKMAVPIIKGIQEKDVAACVKHFVANNQETQRLSVNVEVDDQSLEEIYFPAFKAAVIEGVSYTIMGAYNKLRGDYCCESKFLLQDVLRDLWNFDGIVISDWGACHSTKKALLNGLDIEMSVTTDFDDYYFANPLYDLVEKGVISTNIIDEKIMKILKLMNKLNMLDGQRQIGERNTYNHQLNTLKTAEESIVLLKNEDNLLPINTDNYHSIAVIGENANTPHSNGGGSAAIKALYEHTPLAGISMHLGGQNKLTYVKGYSSDKDTTKDMAFSLREEAIRIAAANDLVIFIGGLNHDFDTEGLDRTDYNLPYEQDILLQKLAEVNSNIVMINISGSAVDLTKGTQYSKALIQSWYNGMEGGRALANVIFGVTTPSGKLPFTFAKTLVDYPSHSIGEFPGDDNVHYKEGIFVGYRHFEHQKLDPLYSFGHGLSYTEFSYENLIIEKQNNDIHIDITIKNTGLFTGKEVVQLYIQNMATSADRLFKELKGFKKVELLPNESKSITFILTQEETAYYHATEGKWIVDKGTYNVFIGSSSKDIRLHQDFVLK